MPLLESAARTDWGEVRHVDLGYLWQQVAVRGQQVTIKEVPANNMAGKQHGRSRYAGTRNGNTIDQHVENLNRSGFGYGDDNTREVEERETVRKCSVSRAARMNHDEWMKVCFSAHNSS